MNGRNKVSRRGFLWLAGLTSGAIGLGKLPGKEAPNKRFLHRPWWVKTIEEPKLWIDNRVYQRYDSRNQIFSSFGRVVGEGRARELFMESRQKTTQWMREGRPGYSLRDRALADAGWTVMRAGGPNRGIQRWTASGRGPEEYGVERYQASPEETAQTVKAAARLFGASLVGVAKLDRRHIYSWDGGKEIVLENVEQPYEDETKRVIPEKVQWVIALAVQMSEEAIKRAPAPIASATTSVGYSLCQFVVSTLSEFIRGLGYIAIPAVNDTALSIPIAMEAGLGELGRHNRLITPEYGPNVRLCKVFTDLPMAIDQPIDFGVAEFCRVCKRCAEACPAKSLSLKDEPDYQVRGIWNNPGHRAWHDDASLCYTYWQKLTTGCSVCFAVCPYSKKDDASIHGLAKGTASVTPAFDRFFNRMDRLFGYGRQKDPVKWWELELPPFGFDTTQGVKRR